MPFTPEEIDSKEFLITLRGYDKDEVKAFLKAVAADFRAALDSASPPLEAPGNASRPPPAPAPRGAPPPR